MKTCEWTSLSLLFWSYLPGSHSSVHLFICVQNIWKAPMKYGCPLAPTGYGFQDPQDTKFKDAQVPHVKWHRTGTIPMLVLTYTLNT
jgi:hypothetical protein